MSVRASKPARRPVTVREWPSVPTSWTGETAVCVASGPSLTAEDVNAVRGKARVIAVNTSYLLAPWADVLYAADEKWWRWQRDKVREGKWPAFDGMRFSLTERSAQYGVTVLRTADGTGLSMDPTRLHAGPSGGRNSGYQAINLAALFGAARILLLGYDMQRGPNGEKHCHADHPDGSEPKYDACRGGFQALVQPLADAGIAIVNCTRRTSVTCFPQMTIDEALAMSQGAAA